MGKAVKVNIKRKETDKQHAVLWIPEEATLEQVHCMMQILLNLEIWMPYAFMLMQQRRSIEKNMAAKLQVGKVFSENEAVRYQNPYPGNCNFVLEKIEETDSYDKNYPTAAETEDDENYNEKLKKYCMVQENWQNLWQGNGNSQKENRRKKRENRKQKLTNQEDTFKSVEEKIIAVSSAVLLGKNEFFFSKKTGSQKQFLMVRDKKSLMMYCEYAGVRIGKNWKKEEYAEMFLRTLTEHPWYYLILLPQAEVRLFLQLCEEQKKGKCSVQVKQEDIRGFVLFLYLGMADVKMLEGEKEIFTYEITLAEEAVLAFTNYLTESRNFEKGTEPVIYLREGAPAGSWINVSRGYDVLSEHIAEILRYYGVLPVEELYQRTKECFGYQFDFRDFMRYLMMRLRLLEQVNTVLDTEKQIRYASLGELNLEKACMIQRNYPAHAYKEINRENLRNFDLLLVDLCKDFMDQVSDQVPDDEVEEIAERIIASIEGNQTWEDLYGILEQYMQPEQLSNYGIWYHLSRLFLNLPVAAFGGYSRMECADGENPYLLLNENMLMSEIIQKRKKAIYEQPYEIQWEFYQLCTSYVKGANQYLEAKVRRFAKDRLKDTKMKPEDLLPLDIMPDGAYEEYGWDGAWYDTEERSLPIVREEKKIYPNDPCPCGSGKKYKKCCGKQ